MNNKVGIIVEAIGGILTAIGMGIGLACEIKDNLSNSDDSSENSDEE